MTLWIAKIIYCRRWMNERTNMELYWRRKPKGTEKNMSHCHFFPMARQPLGGQGLLIFRGLAITHFRYTTLGRTPLDKWPFRRRDLYLTTHNTHKRQTSMPPAGFEPTILSSERPQTHTLDRVATGIGPIVILSTTNPTWTGTGLNPGLCSEGSSTSALSQGTALFVVSE
jgi:hypothetical protein